MGQVSLCLLLNNCESDRKELEALKPNDVNEIVMQDPHSDKLYEGLSSNFYVVMNETVITAPEEHILTGSTQKLILEICQEEKISVKREFPKLDEIDMWEGAFISSKST